MVLPVWNLQGCIAVNLSRFMSVTHSRQLVYNTTPYMACQHLFQIFFCTNFSTILRQIKALIRLRYISYLHKNTPSCWTVLIIVILLKRHTSFSCIILNSHHKTVNACYRIIHFIYEYHRLTASCGYTSIIGSHIIK